MTGYNEPVERHNIAVGNGRVVVESVEGTLYYTISDDTGAVVVFNGNEIKDVVAVLNGLLN